MAGEMVRRRKAPVFVCGFPRSGTTLLYHMLLSAGGFAYYREESWVFDLLVPRFGDLGVLANRRRLMDHWLRSRFFERSGLDADTVRAEVLANCQNGGDFLEIVMGGIARSQGVERWADCTPTHLVHLPEIARTIPDALIVHIIRDGRDAALSYERQNWIRPLPGIRDCSLLISALYWEWMIRKGRDYSHAVAPNYLEVRYENLMRDPHGTLARVSAFIEQPLDYDRIRAVAIGSVSQPNTSFLNTGNGGAFNPVGRWKEIPPVTLARLEALVGDMLVELGYSCATPEAARRPDRQLQWLRRACLSYFEFRHRVKTRTPLARVLTNTDFLKPVAGC